ncbi:putative nonsense-mediated mRNA decay protein [Chaetomidium leptoderma]|uniref:60S ribosomal export protein NMD3 n=1 Tax=Chaetomidium leptoderma TaxID=669021 RepID=A0AAN6VIB3_9PEZI|nr:putative nonsense-mediated mRNA decay protein [Chaetomidium leptoderma]
MAIDTDKAPAEAAPAASPAPANKEEEDRDADAQENTHHEKFPPDEEKASSPSPYDPSLVAESNSHKAEANTLFTSGKYEIAINKYDEAVAVCPNYLDYELAVLRSNIAACHLKLEEWKEAVANATTALDGLDRLEQQEKEEATAEAEKVKVTEVDDADEEIISAGAAKAGPALAANPDDDSIEAIRRKRQDDIARIRAKALMRRARARSELGGWSNLEGAVEDYKRLAGMANLTAADKKIVQAQLRVLPPRAKAAQEKETAEMWGKLKDLGNGLLKPFGLSTDSFKMVKDENTAKEHQNSSRHPMMDLDAPMAMAPLVGTARTGATILCCHCGAPIDGTASAGALCYDCIKSTVDISQGIQRDGVLHVCRDCDRWLMPPTTWVTAALESRELLSVCLKRIRNLGKVRIIDARFVWTEPHSRRIKVKITIQDAVAEGVLMQQSFEVVYVVANQQCRECAKSYTANVWRASVQVRQKVTHKRTFLLLEQLILKHQAHKDTINIKEEKDGIDFYFAHRNQAEAFMNFLKSVVPVHIKDSKHLISADTHTGNKSYKFNYSAEIVPVCRDDLVALPLKLAKASGNITPLVLCHRIGTSVNLLDPNTLQTAEISAEIYWRAPFQPLAGAPDMVEFVVMDIEPTGLRKGKWVLGEATVARASDLGVNDTTYFARTHLGTLLRPGDSVMGYLLSGSNFNSEAFDAIENSRAHGSTIPDVVLVKKHYPNRRKNKRRNWKLKRMTKDEGDLLPKANDQTRLEAEYEMFLRDVEEDGELRAALALYKDTKKKKQQDPDAMSIAETEMTVDDGPKINMEELLDDFDELEIKDDGQQEAA